MIRYAALFIAILQFVSCSSSSDEVFDHDQLTEDEDPSADTDISRMDEDPDADIDMADGAFDEDDIETVDDSEPDDDDDLANDDDSDSDTDIPETVFPECLSYKTPVSSAVLKDADLKEISGIAVSYKNPGLIWVHNDSGGEAALFGIGFDGKIIAKLTLKDAVNTDWEAMSLSKCGADECFYIGNFGDNSLNRDDYSIFVFNEPVISSTGQLVEIEVTDYTEYPFFFEDGHHNSEALAVNSDGTLYIFSKEISVTQVYSTPLLDPQNVTEFKKIGQLDTGIEVPGYPAEAQPSLVTGADINRNGTRLLLRTYGIYTTDNDGIREFIFNKGFFEEIFVKTPVFVPEGKDMQGEAISYNPFTGGYVHISEFYNKVVDFDPNIWVVDCQN